MGFAEHFARVVSRWLSQGQRVTPCEDCGETLADWILPNYDKNVCQKCLEEGDYPMSGDSHRTTVEVLNRGQRETEQRISSGGAIVYGFAEGDVFRDGASPELEAKMALDELQEAVDPESCCNCGYQPEVAPEIILRKARAAQSAVRTLPGGPEKDEMKRKLLTLLRSQQPPEALARVLSQAPDGTYPALSQENLPQTAVWLAEHLKQQTEQAEALTIEIADAINCLMRGDTAEAQAVLLKALEDS